MLEVVEMVLAVGPEVAAWVQSQRGPVLVAPREVQLEGLAGSQAR